MCTKTEMWAGTAETDMWIRVAAHIESVRISEHRFITIGRAVMEHDLLPCLQLETGEFEVLGERAAHPDHR